MEEKEKKVKEDVHHAFPLFTLGEATDAYTYLGAHPEEGGWVFRVWAPKAQAVSVVGDFNGWDARANTMFPLGDGIWEARVPGLEQYALYKFAVTGPDGVVRLKADPYAFHAETRPGTASKLYDLSGYAWGDKAWIAQRERQPIYDRPLNIYEVHLGSWRRTPDGGFNSYRTLAEQLPGYVKELGYTHVELMPVTEHPLDASWGYQCTGYFAATSRFGTPHDFMYLVDKLHQAGIGVILDWVPAHFPKDAFGLYEFDGTPTYEYADSRKGEHADWGTRVFDYSRLEVRSFLFSSANFWMSEYHIDGLRVDAVASMLYLDYGRRGGEWAPNIHGGNENLEAVDFLQKLNEHIFALHPNNMMIAEESTAWAKVSHPTSEGGLGFNLKWNMGWMNDILHYIRLDPYFRQFNHKDITFSLMYAFSENFLLPLSHDEVVHMKGSLVNKMPGDDPQKYAGVRAFYTYMLTHPGKKLTMMGTELAQWSEWHYEGELDWFLLGQDDEDGHRHQQNFAFFKAVNDLYLRTPALWEQDFSWEGFEWLCADDNQNNVISFLRTDKKGKWVMVVCNFSPVLREDYRIGVPAAGSYKVIFSTDDPAFGGGGQTPAGVLKTEYQPMHGREQSLALTVPPMSAMVLECTRKLPGRKPGSKVEKPKSEAKKAAPKAAKAEKPKAEAKKAAPKAAKAEKPKAEAKKAAPKAAKAEKPKAEAAKAEKPKAEVKKAAPKAAKAEKPKAEAKKAAPKAAKAEKPKAEAKKAAPKAAKADKPKAEAKKAAPTAAKAEKPKAKAKKAAPKAAKAEKPKAEPKIKVPKAEASAKTSQKKDVKKP